MVVMITQDFNQIKLLTFKIKNMKKYLYGALALPLLFACSSEDFENEVVSNDQFAGIEKVDAEFSMEGTTRFDGGVWTTEEGDLWGFAWMGDGTVIPNNPADGKAYQNHNLIQTNGIFTPQTSIYVGKYYIYRPYDYTTVTPQAINFNSLVNQPLAEGYESAKQPWKDLAKTAINIGDCWTNVTAGGWPDGSGKRWDKAGIKQSYKLYAAMFSNQTGLDLTYKKNNPTFAADKAISGATDINHTYVAGTAVGAADIYKVTVDLDGAAKSFTYAPTASPVANTADHSGTYWANKSNLGAGQGFTFVDDVITLTPADATTGLSTGDNGSKAWFWFNSLPVTAGNGALATNVQTKFTTSYGIVTVDKTIQECASVFDKYDNTATSNEWIKLAAADANNVTPKTWNLAGAHNTFVNQYGNHKGKYTFDVDFSTGVMNGMDINSDTHLQKLLKYYLASGKIESPVVLNLTSTNGQFKLSKISIALLQTINATKNVKVNPNGLKIIVTQDDQADLGLADKKEVPTLNNVFSAATDVYLSGDCDWTWAGGLSGANAGKQPLTIDAEVLSIINEGTLTVNATNVQLSVAASTLKNAAGATMNITKVTTVKNALTNEGVINVGAAGNTGAELRAYGIEVKNNATSLTAYGEIYNYGVVGVTANTGGHFNNYGYIKMMNNGAITLLSSNELNGDADPATYGPMHSPFAADANMMGIVELPTGNPTALVSVANAAETGVIKYRWDAATYTTPAGNVKYNTIQVNHDIAFNYAPEIKYIEFDGTRTQVVNPSAAPKLPNLKGIYVAAGSSIIIEKTNEIVCSDGAYLGAGATVYKGGIFTYVSTNNYYGNWSTDQIIEY